VRLLLADDRVNLNAQDFLLRTPLDWACMRNNREAVRLLLESPTLKLPTFDKHQKTALHRSCQRETGDLEIIQMLLRDSRIDPNSKDNNHRTALSHYPHNSPEIAECLLNDPRIEMDQQCQIFIIEAVLSRHHLDVLKLLLMHPSFNLDPNKYFASATTDLQEIQLLVQSDQLQSSVQEMGKALKQRLDWHCKFENFLKKAEILQIGVIYCTFASCSPKELLGDSHLMFQQELTNKVKLARRKSANC